jgi:hypothetical protein
VSDTMIPEAEAVWRETGRSAQLNELFAALAKAQGEIGGAKKDSTNPHFKSSYADLASVRDVTQEPLAKNGIAVIQWPRTVERGVEVETILAHSSGQYMTGVLWMPVTKMDAHGVGSAITYGRRYALMAVTGVAPVDDDGNAAAAGSAGSGTDFRPPGPRRMPATAAVAEEDHALLKNAGDDRSTYEVAKRTAAEFFASGALAAFEGLNGSTLNDWYRQPVSPKGRSTNRDALDRMREAFPDLADKVDAAAEEVRLRGGARLQ